ncbi:MAG: DsbA family protein [Deltaproteobacteria bacterium]|nr:DsbA family protein [Deltaproteobacteria bacterium]
MLRDRIQTRVRSRVIRVLASRGHLEFERRRAVLARLLRREARVVRYFHQVDDPYSHLVVQRLDELRNAYDLPFSVHLVSKPSPEFQGSPEHFEAWSLRDAQSIADAYGVTLDASGMPAAAAVRAANSALAPVLEHPDFAKQAFEIGEALWSGHGPAETNLPPREDVVREGDALRRKLGHYLGGTFYFEGEWFWGIDRIRVLETRLHEEGLGGPDDEPLVPEPSPASATGLGAEHVVLDYFLSLRSPYTAVGHARVMDLIARSGVTAKLRPVMPMMMRGIAVPMAKQRYIVMDAAREARARGVPFGRVVDPFGEPVRRAFALLAGALALGRDREFVTEYLSAAWAEGVDITRDAGLRQVADRAGLPWEDLCERSRGADCDGLLDENLDAMLTAGLWGVPSFRVSGGNESDSFACWGQDRIWRVEDEIVRRAC